MVRKAGELVLGMGVILLSLWAYSVFWTTRDAGIAADREVQGLQDQWQAERHATPPGPTLGVSVKQSTMHTEPTFDAPIAPPAGAVFGLMRIPRLGPAWVKPLVEGEGRGLAGIARDDLARGVVHYPGTALPGQVGNFAAAGHRATHGEPFTHLDKVRPGDQILVETKNSRYTYTVTNRAIVEPTRTDVLAAVPGRVDVQSKNARVTLTTCHPRYSSKLRLVVTGRLSSIAFPG